MPALVAARSPGWPASSWRALPRSAYLHRCNLSPHSRSQAVGNLARCYPECRRPSQPFAGNSGSRRGEDAVRGLAVEAGQVLRSGGSCRHEQGEFGHRGARV